MSYNIQWTEKYAGTALKLAGYNLSFLDNFNVSSISEANGTTSTWYSNVHSPFGYASFQTKGDLTSPFNVSNGFLNINMELDGGAWKSGMIQTVNDHGEGFKQSYGYFEIRAALTGGENAWPAFWLLSEATPFHPRVEIDILEAYGADPTGHHTALHIRENKNGVATHDWASDYSGMTHSLFDGEFHTYGVQITKKFIITYMDGKELARTASGEFASGDFYILADLARTNDDPSEGGNVKSSMTIDYVRAYSDFDISGPSIVGNTGADTLVGKRLSDSIFGDAGDDNIWGGKGEDVLCGGGDADVFHFKNGDGKDRITDFSADEGDQIDISEIASVKNYKDLINNHLFEQDGDLVIFLSKTDTITLVGLDHSDVHKADFFI